MSVSGERSRLVSQGNERVNYLNEASEYSSNWHVAIPMMQHLVGVVLTGGSVAMAVSREVCDNTPMPGLFYLTGAGSLMAQTVILVITVHQRSKFSRPQADRELRYEGNIDSLKCCVNVAIASSITYIALAVLSMGLAAGLCASGK